MSGARRTALLLCLAGAVLLLVAGGRDWLVASVPSPAPLPSVEERLSGGDLSAVRAAGLVALAAVAALALARPLTRLLVGALLLLLALAAASAPAALLSDPSRAARRNGVACCEQVTAWPWVALAGGLCVAVAGALSLTGARRWAEPARRFEAAAPTAPSAGGTTGAAGGEAQPTDLWAALDAGDDPTAAEPRDPRGGGAGGGPTLPT